DDHDVAGRDHQLEQERVRLHRAVGGHHLLDAHALALGDPLAERRIAHGGAVGEGAGGVGAQRTRRALGQLLCRDDVERRSAARASAFAAAVPFEPDTIAPAWPIVLPGGAVKPAMYATTGLVTFSAMNTAASSSAEPPISPAMTISSVSGSSW